MNTDFIDRMKVELDELRDRITKLSNFLNSSKYSQVSKVEQELLSDQYHAMKLYESALSKRLDWIG